MENRAIHGAIYNTAIRYVTDPAQGSYGTAGTLPMPTFFEDWTVTYCRSVVSSDRVGAQGNKKDPDFRLGLPPIQSRWPRQSKGCYRSTGILIDTRLGEELSVENAVTPDTRQQLGTRSKSSAPQSKGQDHLTVLHYATLGSCLTSNCVAEFTIPRDSARRSLHIHTSLEQDHTTNPRRGHTAQAFSAQREPPSVVSDYSAWYRPST